MLDNVFRRRIGAQTGPLHGETDSKGDGDSAQGKRHTVLLIVNGVTDNDSVDDPPPFPEGQETADICSTFDSFGAKGRPYAV
ncbi:hypothetical protein KAM428_42570 [Aquipseudomonas alcaligenes]|uniref:Uncharacterized protein n=1 Tax=Aquipseudomonas alcaligenes TaxID=43263 RepID=A0AA37FN60_AQUAC|nr:hypothetical protein KAM426_36390 [Pseudomonas alcaligenes]GIZ69172.1 hypothetical protein KAM428_42570 [Pseudomonas alcaligenes]GIZ77595.1 hypothetical protein KAM430_40040 [Pseudomonas alcaligenes]GIZ81904.1 hypothetical protein KAM432_39520 [Pseudomonas alcaligenes]GIZ86267.1 hypothetical protein KAM434_39620 [Pseudomonas alcaligenes]